MDRRNFLGSVIGLVAGAPFIAKALAERPLPPIGKVPLRLAVKEECQKEIIWFPPVNRMVFNDDQVTLISDELKFSDYFRVEKVYLADAEGIVFSEKDSETASGKAGDSIFLKYTIRFSGVNAEEFRHLIMHGQLPTIFGKLNGRL